jgi:hypothetical protein
MEGGSHEEAFKAVFDNVKNWAVHLWRWIRYDRPFGK